MPGYTGVAETVRRQRIHRQFWWFAIGVGVLLSLFSIRPASAQVLFGSVVGNVTDRSGAAVPGAAVKITEMQTNDARTGVTNETGAYVISTVPAGTYQVEITKPGFRGFVTSDILVNQNNVVRVDAQLEVGTQTEKIEVTAEAAVLQTDRADIHSEVASQALESLPQPTRTYEGLLEAVPGMVIATGQLSGGTNNPSKSMQFSFNGTGTQSAEIRIEGISVNNPWQYYNSSYVPSIEAVQNVNVATNANDAEQSLSGGASVNVILKSGTNETHGAVYAYNINSKFEANNFFATPGTTPPPLNDNNDGANVGGHIIKNKLFYFGSYEGDFSHSATSGVASFPNPTELSGNFSTSGTTIYDPTTGAANGTGKTPFPGDAIPASRVNPIISKIIPLIPPTNLAGSVNDVYLNLPAVYNLHKVDTKADYIPTDKLRTSFRYGTQPYYATFAPMYGPILGGSGGPGSDPCGACNYLQHGATYTISGSATYVVSPTFVIDTTFGTVHPHQLLYPTEANVAYGSQVLGIPGTNTGPLPWAGGVPNFAVSSYATMGYSYPALDYIQPSYEYNANAAKTKGSHTIRFGVDVFKHAMNHIEISPTAFTFSGGATALNGGPSPNQYNSVADFLLGLHSSEANYTQVAQPYLTLRTWDFALYARDQWQVNRKVTLNYGLRWEYYPVPMQANKGINLYNPQTDIIQECGVGGISSTCGIQVSKRLFSPSLGIAYRAFKSFVIRAGFAISPLQDSMARAGMKSFPQEVGAIFNGPNSYTAVGSISNGVPIVSVPAAVNGEILVPAGTGSLFTDPKNYIRGYVESYNVTLQKEFAGGWTVQAGWVGTHALHEYSGVNINYGLLGGGTASQPLDQFGITASTTEVLPWNSDVYEGMQSMIRKRFARGFTTQFSYTFSKDITFQPGAAAGAGLTSQTILVPQYVFYDKNLSSLDRTSTLVWSSTYQLPFGRGKPMLQTGVLSQIVGGWTLNGMFTHYSGVPFTVTSSSTSCNCPGNSQTANQILTNVAQVGNGVGGNAYFNPLAYAPVTNIAFGTSGFDQLRGPGPTNLDMNIFRDFRITERFKLQVRAESFNISNTPHFSAPGANASNLQLNPDGSIKNLNGFSQITNTTPLGRLIDPRYFRFGVRFSF
jgi:hypothetical protein